MNIKTVFNNIREKQRKGLEHNYDKDPGEAVLCHNCGSMVTGNYCSVCGQSRETKRLSQRQTFVHILATLIFGDNSFFTTVRDLLWRPGYVAHDYIT